MKIFNDVDMKTKTNTLLSGQLYTLITLQKRLFNTLYILKAAYLGANEPCLFVTIKMILWSILFQI